MYITERDKASIKIIQGLIVNIALTKALNGATKEDVVVASDEVRELIMIVLKKEVDEENYEFCKELINANNYLLDNYDENCNHLTLSIEQQETIYENQTKKQI